MADLATVYANGRLKVAERYPWLVGDDPVGHSDKEYVDVTIVLDVEQAVLKAEWKEMHPCDVAIHETEESVLFGAFGAEQDPLEILSLSRDLLLKEGAAQFIAESFADKGVKTDPAQISVAIQSLLMEVTDD